MSKSPMQQPASNGVSDQTDTILRGATSLKDPQAAAAALAAQIGGSPAALRVVFASPDYDLDLLGPALFGDLADAPLIGCTTAGEIGPNGYLKDRGLTGFSLPKDEFEVDLAHFGGIREIDISGMGQRASQAVTAHSARSGPGQSFAMLLVDGLSMREDVLTSTIQGKLGGMPLCGGSAGQDLEFSATRLLVDGAFQADCATLALVKTARPFEVFKTQHFLPTETKLVVTGADPGVRRVTEIDGYPATTGYAKAIGIESDRLSPEVYSKYPLVVRVGGADYVRSVQSAGPDGSLVFLCAIDDGLVLTLASGVDLVENLEQQALALEEKLGHCALTLGFDCVLRRLECLEQGLEERVDVLLRRLSTVGFATYGEQIGAMHVNQTLTGVAIGPSA